MQKFEKKNIYLLEEIVRVIYLYGQQHTGTMAEKQFMKNWIVKGTKNSMLKVFFGLGDFYSFVLPIKNYREMFFLQFYFVVLHGNRCQASSDNRYSVENQPRVRAAKNSG